MFNLVFYETPTGKRPVAEFILGLPQNLKAKAVRDIDILEERGNQNRIQNTFRKDCLSFVYRRPVMLPVFFISSSLTKPLS